ncbi:hypothetical protein [Paraburkholderia haematera]|uniref:hypothetical protein n=1 Tax=Paraburkholderia haematera TaxID=2793077 RepID=UPI001B8D860C|nr:hypothetical protein [Paraburkholderia haematera]
MRIGGTRSAFVSSWVRTEGGTVFKRLVILGREDRAGVKQTLEQSETLRTLRNFAIADASCKRQHGVTLSTGAAMSHGLQCSIKRRR